MHTFNISRNCNHTLPKRSLRKRRQKNLAWRHLLFAEKLEDRVLLAGDVILEFDTSLESLNLGGGPYPMPLASDPLNSLGDSVEGYGFVDSQVSISLSSQRTTSPGPPSLGNACAILSSQPDGRGCEPTGSPAAFNPIDLDGETLFVDSFFDVFFDITVTDVDPRPGRDFAGQPDGASFVLPDNGPAHMQSIYSQIFDLSKPLENYGLIPPPEVSPYIGHFQIEIPLGGDINGNANPDGTCIANTALNCNDKIKFTIASHAAGDSNRTFTQLPDGTVLDTFDSAAFLAGAIVDEHTDPPFTLGAGDASAPAFTGPGALIGPTTATSTLLNPIERDFFPRTIGQLLIELPPPPGSNTPSPELPPQDGEYRTAADIHAEFQGQQLHVVLQDIRHRPFGTVVRTALPKGDELEEFQSVLLGTAIVNGNAVPVELTGPVQVVTYGKVGETTGTFQTEMISMQLHGQIPGPTGGPVQVEVRESPTLPSTGRTSITDIGGGRFQIDSFFDIFTELSVDGGNPIPAFGPPARVDLVSTGIRTPNPDLPPTDGVYRTPQQVHAEFQGPDLEIVLQDISHRPFADRIERTEQGPDEVEKFRSSLTGTAIVTSFGLGLDHARLPVELTGPVETIVFGKAGQTTGRFDTEILSMDLTGHVQLPDGGSLPVVIRENPSPTAQSQGQVNIQDLGNGRFQMDSFFDVWTEISVGPTGSPYIPSTGSAHVELVQAPILVTGAGPAAVNVFFEGSVEGTAFDDNNNGLDDVVSQLVRADFDGYHPQLGPIQIRLSDDQPSLGQIEELVNNTPGVLDVDPFKPGDADSFFDVFFDITVQATGQVLTTEGPTRVRTIIGHKPPQEGERYVFDPPQPVQLIDKASGQPTGIFIRKEIHDESPKVEHDVFPRTVGQVLIQLPDGSRQLITTAGPSQVDVYFEGPAEGDASDDDGDGLDEVVSELVQADFDGFHPLLGPVHIGLRNDIPSLGRITEQANNTPGMLDVDPFAPGNADSFFDVFFEITLPATGQTLVTRRPTRVESVIKNKPPTDGERYIFNPPQPVELFDAATGQGTGIFIVREIHDEDPTVEHDVFPRTIGQLVVELPPPPGLNTPNTDLPPEDGEYRTASDVHAEFEGPALTVVLQDIRHRVVAGSVVRTVEGADEIEEFESTLQGTAVIDGVEHAVNLTGPVVVRTHGKAGQTTGSFDTEMISMSLSGQIPDGPTIEVRESPSLPSLGHTTIKDIGGGRFRIDSFFDVFTELAVTPAGTAQNFIPSTGAARVDLVQPGIQTPNPNLPPTDGVYRTPQQVHAEFQGPDLEIVLQDIKHRPFADRIERIQQGPNEIERFNSSLTGTAIVTSESLGLDHVPLRVELTGPVETIVYGKAGNTTGSFQTEIVSMSLSGDVSLPGGGSLPIVIHESPTVPSPGQVTIQDIGNGQFRIDSFFDVFTEILVAAGTVPIPSTGPARVELTQAPILVSAAGPAQVDVYFEGPAEGDASDDDGNGLDEVVSELVQADFDGFHPRLGPVHISLRDDLPSLGRIEELVNNTPGVLDVHPFKPGDADSFFDVFFDITVQATGQVLTTSVPTRVQTIIGHKPPQDGERYIFNPPEPVELIDKATGQRTGIFITKEIHDEDPTVEHDVFPRTVGQVLIQLPDGSQQLITTVGPSQVDVYFEGPAEGDASDDDLDGLDEVVSELVQADFAGFHPALGPVHIGLRNDIPSLGKITEQVNNTPGLLDVDPFAPGNADSFFDVFFEITLPATGQTLVTRRPTRVESVIDTKPPENGERYIFNPPIPVELFERTDTGALIPTGIFIVKEIHDESPTVEHDVFPRTIGQLVVELPPPPGLNTPNPELPPEDGEYRTASDVHAEFQGPALTVVLQDIRHRVVADSVVRTVEGADEIEEFRSTLQGTAVIGGVEHAVNLTGPVKVRALGKANQTTGTFDTEILSMDLTGQIPGGPTILVRESPSRPSTGRTTITDIGGGQFRIDSFFDVFTELSVSPPGTTPNFIPSTNAARVDLVQPGIRTPHPELPPVDGVYRTPQQVHAEFQGPDLQIVLQDIRHRPFADQIDRQHVGDDELEFFNSSLTGTAVLSSDTNPALDGLRLPVELTGPVTTVVRGKGGATTGSWDTEILSMSLSGDLPLPGGGSLQILIEERSDKNSLGHVTVQELGSGQFHVDSFFDVWTEISFDGGPPIPSTGPARVELVQAPILVTGAGPAQVDVYFEGPNEGDATDDDGDGLDEVVSELVQADFDGFHPQLGPVHISLRNDLPSLGQIEERVNNTPGVLDVGGFANGGDADSFFDVFFDITVQATGQVLTTAAPTRVQTIIGHKPPQDGERYIFNPPEPVELIDKATGRPTGIFITKEIHDENPTVEIDKIETTTALLQLVGGPIGPVPQPFILRGSSEVHVYFEGPAEGDATDDEGNGLDEVVTELVDLNLTNGNITLSLNAAQPSLGQIEEQINTTLGRLDIGPFAPGQADSFFDVFFQIDVGGGLILHNNQPLRIEAVIKEKPPIARYFHILPPNGPLQLFDASGQPSGIFLTKAEHYTGFVERDEFPSSTAEVVLQSPDGGSEVIRLQGTSTVDTFFERNEGVARDDDGDGLDEVETEMVQMDLRGNSSLGPIVIRRRIDKSSPGLMEETVDRVPGTLDVAPFSVGTVDSFFDVFFEVEVGGQTLFGAEPYRVASKLTHKPPAPGEAFVGNGQVELLNASGQPTGFVITAVRHIPVPAAPEVIDVAINGSSTNLNRSGIATVAIRFDRAVTVNSPTSLRLRNQSTGLTIDLSGATLSGNGTDTVIWDLRQVTLPNGNYVAELPASEVHDGDGLPLGSSFAFHFIKRTGDLNGDSVVNFDDYREVGRNFDPLPGEPFRAGDADGNGAVNFGDYGFVARNFGGTVTTVPLDFGDALESGTSFPTTLANDGARHVIGSTYLGNQIDAEPDGQPSPLADGDGADEDGVNWGTSPLLPGSVNTIGVTVTTASISRVFVNAWVDLNQDGDWDDAGEHVLNDVLAGNGPNLLQINVPTTAALGDTFARVRVTDTAGYGYRGLAPTGEVEDYKIRIGLPTTSPFARAADAFFGDLERKEPIFADNFDDWFLNRREKRARLR